MCRLAVKMLAKTSYYIIQQAVQNSLTADDFQLLIQNGKQLQQDLRQFNKFDSVTNGWCQRRLKLIDLLNGTADDLTELNENTRTADIVGTGVSIVAGVVAVAGLIAVPFTAGTSAAVRVAVAGGAQLTGTGTSLGAQIFNQELTKMRLEELQVILQRDAHDITEIQRIMSVINGAIKGINRFMPILGKIIRMGQAGVSFLLSDMSEKERAKAWGTIKQIIQNDDLITFTNRMANAHPSVGSQPQSSQNNLVTGLSYTFRFANSICNISMALPTVGVCRGAGGAAGAVPTVAKCVAGGVAVGLNVVAIGLDLYHLVKIASETRDPQYIQDLREAAKQIKTQLENFKEDKKND